MSTPQLPIEYLDTGKIARDKINNSFNAMVETVAGYRPHIEGGYWWIGDTNTGVKAKGDNVEMKVDAGYIRYKSSSVNEWTQIIAVEDLKGDKGDTGDAATLCVGTVCTGAPGSDVCVTNSGDEHAAVLNFTIPRGSTGCTGATGASICAAAFSGDDIVFTKDNGCTVTLSNAKDELKGDTGAAATVDVGCVTTGAAGTDVCVTNSGTTCAAVLNFTIPQGIKGDDGAAATVTAGTTTTGEPGTCACVTNSGTSSAAVLDFTIPKGSKGDTGATGASIVSAAFSDNDIVFTKDDSCTVTLCDAKTTLKGDKGDTGCTGATGNGISSVTTSKSGKTTTVTMNYTSGDPTVFCVQDGADGAGSGDMCSNTYDPNGKMADAFDYCNFIHTPTIPTDNCELSNGCGYITSSALSGYAQTCDIPTDNCQLTNGCGYTTCTGTVVASDLNAYAKTCDLGTAASKNTGTSSGCVPVLDVNGHLASSTMPGVALTDTYTVSAKACLTTLSSADQGDIGIVTGENKTYVLSVAPYSCAANWKELLTPTDAVTSVNGQTGAVTLSIPTDNCELSNGCGYTTCTGTLTSADKTSAISDSKLLYNGQNVNTKINCVGISTSANLVGSDTNVAIRSNPSNPFIGLQDSCGTPYYLQSSNGEMYFGPTSSLAMKFDASGNATFQGGSVTAKCGFIKTGGTSSQFLKADGSVDSNTYALSTAIPTNNNQLTNGCGYTTCTGTLTSSSLKTVNGCCLVGSGDVIISGLPAGGSNGQVITKTSGGAAWCDPSGGITNDTTCTTSTVTGIWAGTEAQYNSITTKCSTVIYHVF